jgi:hypothetical protein
MTQIVLNPEQLVQSASALHTASGEYQAIGAQVYGCDCGCMPADVAAVVDGVTADIRSGLQDISAVLGGQASDLVERAGVSQDDGFTAVGAAWGDAVMRDTQTVDIGGGFDTSIFGTAGGDAQTVLVGGGFDTSVFGDPDGDYQTVDVGGGFDTSVFGDAGRDGQTVLIGGDFSLGDTSNIGNTLATLMGMAGAQGDTLTQGMLSKIMDSMFRSAQVWTES